MPDRFLGQTLDDYVIQARLGRGANAVVFRAYQTSLHRDVALKVVSLNSLFGDDEKLYERFDQEARLIASLEHLHILPVYNYHIVRDDEFAYIAMRLLTGGTLAERVAAGPLSLEETVDILTQIASGLAYAHAHGIIHRDLKPSNIMFDQSGSAYLTDFGLAKMMLTAGDLTQAGHVVGTPSYIAPEGLRGEALDQRADIYSLGVLTFQMLTGRLPFEAADGSLIALIHKHLEEPPPRLHSLNPAIPADVEAVVLRALAKRPADRYQDTNEMALALNRAIGRPVTTSSLRTPASGQRATRRRLALIPLALIVLLVALLLAFSLRQLPPGPLIPTLLADATGVATQAAPSADELELAQVKLGKDSFIAFIACTLDSIFQATRAREIGEWAAQAGIGYRVYDSQSDRYQQVTQIEKARVDGAQAIILCPLDATDSDVLGPTLRSLRAAHIPIVFITLFTPGYGVMLDSDNYQIGLLEGRYAGQLVNDEHGGKASVVILDYPGFVSADQRSQGMADGLRQIAPGATLVGHYRGFTRDFARQSVEDMLAQGIQPDIIISMNDAGSTGAIDVLQAHDIAPDQVSIVSANGEALALDYIRRGLYLRATVDVNRELGSRIAYGSAIRMLAGATLPSVFIVPPGKLITRSIILSATPTAAP